MGMTLGLVSHRSSFRYSSCVAQKLHTYEWVCKRCMYCRSLGLSVILIWGLGVRVIRHKRPALSAVVSKLVVACEVWVEKYGVMLVTLGLALLIRWVDDESERVGG